LPAHVADGGLVVGHSVQRDPMHGVVGLPHRSDQFSVSSLRNLARTGSGAITKIAFIWLPAAVRALTAERRASWSGRRPPIAGSLTGLDRSANTARAAW
jgi:hypothetical protein